MRSRRISCLLAAAAVCGCVADSAPSVRGVDDNQKRNADDNNRSIRPQHEQEQEQEQKSANADKLRPRRSLENEEYWWHENQPDEKDVVYQDLGVSSNVNDQKLQMLHSKNSDNAPANALDEGEAAKAPQGKDMEQNSSGGNNNGNSNSGRGSFSVYSIGVDNEPDTSELPHRQPSRTPTPKPTRFPTKRPTPNPTRKPTNQPIQQQSGSAAEGWVYYPLWSAQFSGCAYSDSPPDVYVTILNDGEMTYLFDRKDDCCDSWFEEMGSSCMMESLTAGGYSAESGNGNNMVVTNGHVGGSSSDDSSHGGGGNNNNNPKPNPPSPPANNNNNNPKPNPPSPPSFGSISNTSPNNNPPSQPTRPNPPPPPSPPSTPNRPPSMPNRPPPNNNPPSTPNNNLPPQPNAPSRPNPIPPRPGVPTYNVATTPNGNTVVMDGPPPAPAPWDVEDTPEPSPWPTFVDQDDSRPGNTPAQDDPYELTFRPTTFDEGQDQQQQAMMTSSMMSSSAVLEAMLNGGDYGGASTTTVYYEESFEDGYMHLTDPWHEYFSWSRGGNRQWKVEQREEDGNYDGTYHHNDTYHVATITGSGNFAMEGTLKLTIGGTDTDDDDLKKMMRDGAYVTFGVKADVGFPTDSLTFSLDDKILGYWIVPSNGWTRVSAYIPPSEDEDVMHNLTWVYSYFGSSDEQDEEMTNTAQLDGIVIEATTGDWSITDDDLYDIAVDGASLPLALSLNHPFGDSSWEIGHDNNAYDGSRLFTADSRKIIREANRGNNRGITSYHAKATMSITVITGPYGGVLHFAIYSQVHAPIDVLEIGLDGDRIMASTGTDDWWQDHSIELTIPGKHIVTFSHISNPAHLDMEALEGMGQPGSSKIDGIRYVDNIDPALITPDPTYSPTREPSMAPTPFGIPVQNYCSSTLNSVRDTCYTEDAVTCNEGEPKCPAGQFCWGFVECEIPELLEVSAMWWLSDDTPEPTSSPVLPPQNYCGTGLATIKRTCASGNVLTCNEGEGPCPTGTHCFGNIECDVASSSGDENDIPDPTKNPTPSPTPIPPQNYCGMSTSQIRLECAAGDPPKTCNDGEEACPFGTYCFGNVRCEQSEEVETPQIMASPILLPQNYCGRQLAEIKETCASGDLPTCNDNDGPCPSGTYCWGNVECDPIEEPTPAPQKETMASFLDSFFGGSNSGGDTESSEDEASDCPEGTGPVQGLPGCCVADPSFLGDGACDAYAPYNTAECGYDLGDCCQESCNSDASFGCDAKEGDAYGPFGFYCLDPRYGSIDEKECGATNREWVGDGGCDPEYNTAACGWDGGDCCRDSCDEEFAYYACGRDAQPFDCKNPDIIYRAGYVP